MTTTSAEAKARNISEATEVEAASDLMTPLPAVMMAPAFAAAVPTASAELLRPHRQNKNKVSEWTELCCYISRVTVFPFI